MDIKRITEAAVSFRNAIEAVSSSLGVAFEAFPLGSCGDATTLLGTYLIDKDLGRFQYMLGNYGSEEEGSWSSHAWLQSLELVVDITADQFPDVDARVIVLEESAWHIALNGEAQNVADYRIYDGYAGANLGGQYERILAQIAAA